MCVNCGLEFRDRSSVPKIHVPPMLYVSDDQIIVFDVSSPAQGRLAARSWLPSHLRLQTGSGACR